MNHSSHLVELRQKKKELKKNLVNPFKVGQIFYDCWGYEQTNVDYYQVIAVKPKSVVIRAIEGERKYDASFQSMSGKVIPLKDKFEEDSEPVTKPVLVTVNQRGKPIIYLKSRHGWMDLYDGGTEGKFFSCYA